MVPGTCLLHPPVLQSNHLVVLGWNNQAASLLRQVAVAQRVSHNEVFR
jgi:hypothetical protein